MTSRTSTVLRATAAIALLSAALPAAGQTGPATDAGAYLAARQAGLSGDYAAASGFFQAALIADPNNTALMEQTLIAYLGTGQGETAASLARSFTRAGGQSQIAHIALMANAARNQNWQAIFDNIGAGYRVGPLIDGLAQGWAHVGQDDMAAAIDAFDAVAETAGLRPFAQHHKALALTLNGDLAAADAIYSLPPGEGLPPTRASVIAHLQILCALGAFERAGDIMDRAFGEDPDPELSLLRDAIAENEVPAMAPPIESAAEGIAYAFNDLAEILSGEASESYLLIYAQTSRYIAPQDAENQIITARLLSAMEQYDQAAQTFAQVSTGDPAFHSAELGRAEALNLAGRFEKAIEVLTQLTRSHPDLPASFASLGGIYRQQEAYDAAIDAYDAAIEGYGEDASNRWWLLYSRGITHERLDDWPAAEADFRAALALNPGNPSVLNYLGYSMVDRGQSANYAEALEMIEAAVAARPDSGAIVDSLAWVYYKLGRYQEAVAPMERAAELEPNDPVISDHLGDVYWQVGRKTEARFQWRRALSFEPEEEEADRIRRKLSVGLDAVYREDGETPAPAAEAAFDDI